MLNVAVATAEVYAIDGYFSGAPLSYDDLAIKLDLGIDDMDLIAFPIASEYKLWLTKCSRCT